MRSRSIVLSACALLSAASAALAADFIVTNTADTGPGSLRSAIQEANALPGHDRIVFNIPAPGVQTIRVSPPPAATGPLSVTDPVTIDGYTQPGAKPNAMAVGSDAVLLIEVRAGQPGTSTIDGLVLNTGDCTIRGLSITGFLYQTTLRFAAGAGIVARGTGGHTIEGNFLGVMPDGTSPPGSRNGTGILLEAGGNAVGGLSPSARNVIGGSVLDGILSSSERNVIAGNYIGTNPAGTVASPNSTGIRFRGGPFTDSLVGGRVPAAANVISANGTGIVADASSTDAARAAGFRIEGNSIGVAANGSDALGNASDGIVIDASHIRVGGLEPGAGNVIAFNGRDGVAVTQASGGSPSIGNTILSNSIFSNGRRDMSVGFRNDIGDADSGPNHRQNFPVIMRHRSRSPDAPPAGFNGSLEDGLNSTPLTEFTLQFFYYTPRPQFLGNLVVKTDAAGNARFRFLFYYQARTPIPEGSYFTATATNPEGSTSEFTPREGLVRLANISTRGRVGVGDDIMIAGFITRSAGPKRLLLRALGPSVAVPGRLADPALQLFDANGSLLAKNDDWKTGQQEEIRQTGAAPQSDVESALIAELSPGAYTAHASGADGGSGNAIVEVYDLDFLMPDSGRLVNISTRGFVGTDDDLLIGGVLAPGDAAHRVIIRAIGPDVGAPGALEDPLLELRDASGALVAQNDNWRDQQEQEIRQTGLAPNDDRDAAIVTDLIPSNYTAIVRGKDGRTGVALVEFYDLKN